MFALAHHCVCFLNHKISQNADSFDSVTVEELDNYMDNIKAKILKKYDERSRKYSENEDCSIYKYVTSLQLTKTLICRIAPL